MGLYRPTLNKPLLESLTTTVSSLSDSWMGGNSSFTTVQSNSADWESVYTTVLNISADGESVYTTVLNLSADWETVSDRLPLSGGTMLGDVDIGGNNITNIGTLCATYIQSVSSSVEYMDITVYELSGFEVHYGDLTLVSSDLVLTGDSSLFLNTEIIELTGVRDVIPLTGGCSHKDLATQQSIFSFVSQVSGSTPVSEISLQTQISQVNTRNITLPIDISPGPGVDTIISSLDNTLGTSAEWIVELTGATSRRVGKLIATNFGANAAYTPEESTITLGATGAGTVDDVELGVNMSGSVMRLIATNNGANTFTAKFNRLILT